MAIIRRRDTERDLAPSRSMDPFDLMQQLMRWDPFREMAPGAWGAAEASTFVPSFEVKETKDAYLFKADLPGVKEEDLDLSLTGNRLTISGQRQQEQKEEGETYYAFERSYGSFSRSFTLPEGTDAEHVQGELKDGVLTVVVPKTAEVKSKRILLKGRSSEEKKAQA